MTVEVTKMMPMRVSPPVPTFNLQNALERAKTEVYSRFPEMKGSEPKYLARRIKNRPVVSRYLVFRALVMLENGERQPQIVRVYLSPQGEIARLIVSKGG